MKIIKFMTILGTAVLAAVPLTAWTGFYDAVEAPKHIAAFWGTAVLTCAWIMGWAAGYCRFWPTSVLMRTACIFSLCMALSGPLNGFPSETAEGTLRWIGLTVLLMALDSLFNSEIFKDFSSAEPEKTSFKEDSCLKIIGALSLSMAAASAYGLLQKAAGLGFSIFGFSIKDPMGWNNPELSLGRTISTFGNPDYFGVWLAAVLPLSLAFILKSSKIPKICMIAAWILCAAAAFLTQTRAAWLGMGAAFIAWSAAVYAGSSPEKIKKVLLVQAGIIIISVLTVGAVSYFDRNSEDINNNTAARIKSLTNLQDLSLRMRFYFWRSALNTSFAHPFIGAGPGGQTVYCMADRSLEPAESRSSGKTPDSVHNQYLNVLSSSGWITFIIYLCLAGFSLNSSLHIKDRLIRASLFSAFISFWISHIFLDCSLSDDILAVLMLTAAGMLSESESCTPVLTKEDAEDPIFSYNSRVRLTAAVCTAVIGVSSLACTMNAFSLYFAEKAMALRSEAALNLSSSNPDTAQAQIDYAQACAYLEKALKCSPSWQQWQYYLELGKTIMESNKVCSDPYKIRFQKAREMCDIAAAMNFNSPYAHRTLAAVTAGGGPELLDLALHELNKAQCIDSRNTDILLTKAQMLIDLGRYEDSLRILDITDKICQSRLNLSLYHRAAALMMLGRFDQAQPYIKELIEKDPSSRSSIENLVKNLQNSQKKAG